MWNLDFRAPGLNLDVQELVARAWPQASPKQRNTAISAGEVRIAGEVTREAKARVAPGSRVQVVAREGQLVSSPPAIEILQRGQGFCVVDKPTGWPSHAATAGGPDARALVAASLDCSIDEIWPVHRLDADVSGAWLIALSRKRQRVACQLRSRRMSSRRNTVPLPQGSRGTKDAFVRAWTARQPKRSFGCCPGRAQTRPPAIHTPKSARSPSHW